MLCNHWLETLDRALVRGGALGVAGGFAEGGALGVARGFKGWIIGCG